MKKKLLLVCRQMTIVTLNGTAGIAIVLILYGIGTEVSPCWRSPCLDKYAPGASAILTLLATAFTAWTAWFPTHSRPPDVHSQLVVAPIVTLAVLTTLGYMYFFSKLPPDYVVNGFALLGLIGSIFRTLPFSEEPGLRESTSTAPNPSLQETLRDEAAQRP